MVEENNEKIEEIKETPESIDENIENYEKRVLEICESVVRSYLSSGENADSLSELWKINSGDKKALKEHLVVLNNFFSTGIGILRKDCPDEDVSPMISKAQYELDLILKDCDKDDENDLYIQQVMNDDILDIIRLFDKQGHSGFSASYAIPIIDRLLKQSFVTPLTGGDDEWEDTPIDPTGYVMNKREYSIFKDTKTGKAYYNHGKAFSDDGGKTWYTSADSSIEIKFPLNKLPETEYVITNNNIKKDGGEN